MPSGFRTSWFFIFVVVLSFAFYFQDDEEMEKAATKIQATYRGYKTRSDMSMETPSVTKDTNENDSKAEDETKGESETKE